MLVQLSPSTKEVKNCHFLVEALCGLAILSTVYAWRNSGDITKGAAEILHRGKAGIQRDTGDFHRGFFEQLGRFLQSAGVEPLAKRLSGGRLYARGDLIKRQLHNIGDILSRADLPPVPHFYDGYCAAKTGYGRVLISSSQRRCRTPV